jgi:riboflavin synthase
MFTGIIEHVGSLHEIQHGERESRLVTDLGPLVEGTHLGDSIAHNGICLTVVKLEGHRAWFDAGAETRRKTTLGSWRAGQSINLERALAVGQRLGGHLVSGHVDGVGRLLERRPEGGSERFTFTAPEQVMTVEKGSVTIDGISLTTWDCRGARFSISVVPHTLAHTTLGDLRPGTPVNLEQDILGRWVEAMMKRGDAGRQTGSSHDA